MKKNLLLVLLWLTSPLVFSQNNQPSKSLLSADKWIFAPDKVTFIIDKDGPVMKILPGSNKVIAKDLTFSNGTIEFDVKPNNISFFFRMQDEKESESFYFRTSRAGNSSAMDAVQYTPYIDGVNMWDMYGHFQTNATYTKEQWNHVKLVVSGSRMLMYVNSPDKPTLIVDKLEGNTSSGKIAFEGEMQIANLVVKNDEVAGLSSVSEPDPIHNDPRYIRRWAVSDPIVTPKNIDFSYDFLPDPDTKWKIVESERRGLVNLTRLFGKSEPRRITWLKVNIKSDKVQKKKVDFGFGDDVWVFLNGQIAYVDKNLEGRPISKTPEGRCSIENTSFNLPLKVGDNELLIGVANDFFGWGVIARLEDLNGIDITPQPAFDSRLVKIAPGIADGFIGTYIRPEGTKMVITKADKSLLLSIENSISGPLYPMAENRFFMRSYPLQIEFIKDSNGKPTGLAFYNEAVKLLEAKRAD